MTQMEDTLETKNENPKSYRGKELSMDEAITETGYGFFNYLLIFVSGLIVIGVALEICGILYVLPVSQCDLNLTSSEKGILASSPLFGIICSSHLWGYLADTKGRRAVILPTLFIALFFSVWSSLVQNFYVLATLRFTTGFFASGSSATIYAYLSEFHNSKRRSQAIMGAAVIYSILCVLMPLIAWIVINQDWQFYIPLVDVTYKPWRLFFVVCSMPATIGALVFIFLPESPKFVLGQGKKDEAYEILQTINRWNNGRNSSLEHFDIYEDNESIENRERILDCKKSRFPLLKSVWIQTAPLFKPPYLSSTILICIIQFFIYATGNGFFMFYIQILNKLALHSDNFDHQPKMMCDIINTKPLNMTAATEVTVISASKQVCVTKLEIAALEQSILYEVSYGIIAVMIAILINKIGKFTIMSILLVTTGIGGFLCMATDLSLLHVLSVSTLMECTSAVSVLNSVTVESYPTTVRAMAMCISLMFGRLGGVIGSNVSARLLDNHCQTLFYLSGSSLIAMAVLAFFIPNIHKNASNSDKPLDHPRLSVISARL